MILPAVFVFVKAPDPGKVKTRLAGTIGPDKAAQLYSQWVHDIFNSLQPLRPRVRIVGYFAGADVGRFGPWSKFADEWIEQPPGDLGGRLAFAFSHGFTLGSPVIAIGTDCLALRSEHVDAAVAALLNVDVVLGPATDGGYYLVGATRAGGELFENVRWSSPNTLSDQVARCNSLGLCTSLLEELSDIDTEADWNAWRLSHSRA